MCNCCRVVTFIDNSRYLMKKAARPVFRMWLNRWEQPGKKLPSHYVCQCICEKLAFEMQALGRQRHQPETQKKRQNNEISNSRTQRWHIIKCVNMKYEIWNIQINALAPTHSNSIECASRLSKSNRITTRKHGSTHTHTFNWCDE